MRFTWASIVACGMGLVGCAQPQGYELGSSAPNYQLIMQGNRERCMKANPDAATKKPLTPYMACYTAADVAYWQTTNPFRHNIALEYRSSALALAEKYDAGSLSKERLETEMALLESNLNQRLAAAGQQQAEMIAQQQAAQQQRSMALMAAGSRMMAPTPSITCQTWMNTTTCR